MDVTGSHRERTRVPIRPSFLHPTIRHNIDAVIIAVQWERVAIIQTSRETKQLEMPVHFHFNVTEQSNEISAVG